MKYYKLMANAYSCKNPLILKINGNDLFRLQKNNLSIFVSQKFVQAIRKNKLTGFSFTDVRTV